MKNKKLLKIASLILSVLMLASVCVVSIPASAAAQFTFYDFDGENTSLYRSTNNQTDRAIIDSAKGLSTINGNGVYLPTDNLRGQNITGPYSKGYQLFPNAFVAGENWGETTRPTRVQFSFKIGATSTTGLGQNAPIEFDPLYDLSGDDFWGTKFVLQLNTNGSLKYKPETYSGLGQQFKAETTGTVTVKNGGYGNGSNLLIDNTYASINEDPVWNEADIQYDWSKFDAANGWTVGFTVKVSADNGRYLVYTNEVKYDPVNTSYTSQDACYTKDTTPTATKGYSFAIGSSIASGNGYYSCIDNLRIWSYDAANPETTFGPTATSAMKSKGYQIATRTTAEDDIKIKMGFDFGAARDIAEANGDKIAKFGALLVPGKVDAATLQAKLSTMVAANKTEDGNYVRTEQTVGGEIAVPNEYTVTITNSGEGINMNKSASAIGYLVTEAGAVYYTVNNNADKGIVDGMLQKSSFILLCDVMKDYIENDTTDGLLTAAIAEYNSANSASLDVTAVTGLANGAYSADNAEILKYLHFAVNN